MELNAMTVAILLGIYMVQKELESKWERLAVGIVMILVGVGILFL